MFISLCVICLFLYFWCVLCILLNWLCGVFVFWECVGVFVCLCVCAHTCVCLCVHFCVCMLMWMWVSECVFMFVNFPLFVICASVYLIQFVWLCEYVNTHVYILVCLNVMLSECVCDLFPITVYFLFEGVISNFSMCLSINILCFFCTIVYL